MPQTSDERALATRLSRLSDSELTSVFTRRAISPSAPWHDFFDAAEGLLDAASIDRALVRLPRSALAALAVSLGAPTVDLTARGLADEDGRVFQAVAARVRAASGLHPEAFAPAPEPAAPAAADPAAAAASAERVFGAVGALADVLLTCLHAPLSRTGTGTVSAADRRRLVEAGALGDAEELDDLVAAAEAAGLVQSAGRRWVASDDAEGWLTESTAQRWQRIVEGLRAHLPEALRTDAGGYLPLTGWAQAYPLDPDWAARSAQLLRLAQRWGLVTPTGEEPPWAQPLRAGAAPDVEALTVHLPAEIDRVYLQADLTAIAPGPLAPALDLRLRGIARRESRAQASTYRFSADTLSAGMTAGETAVSVREFLTELSLTGIPQPLDYLIESIAGRHGRVTVRTDTTSGRTSVESDDPSLLDTIAVDHALRPLGLVADRDLLTTRVDRDTVYWSLADARYPVIAVDEPGEPIALRRGRPGPDAADVDAEPYARLIARLRAGEGGDADAAWLERELEQAVRGRSVIAVVVRLPDGSERTFTLEASGLGGGRLRGRDRGADVERTLPVSSIVSVRPVP